ncbi:SNAI1 protein, partial [Polyodon spathula]|nr:protein snail homolog Sna-like [Polyodon spathula]MBN3273619.1 SNAI1 protein [Polyodon spathula]
MPRSFLVKKYFTSKKPNYSELESQTVLVSPVLTESYPGGEISAACYPSALVWDVGLLLTPEASPLLEGPSPMDLSSLSSSEEDEGRSSEPPSPTPAEHFPCTCCSKSYSSPAGLSHHQLSHCQGEEGVANARAFRCKHCPKEYSSLGALKMHIRSHTLPCVCTTCGKAFSRPWLLQGHIRTHTGERPFSCPHCSRAFADRSNLRAHLQTHAEVKKYQCTTCSRTFSRMSLLHKHSKAGCCVSS